MANSRTVSFETLGCRYNRYETAEMAHELASAGYRLAERDETSDVVVINTCTVTDRSDARCRAAIRKARQEHPGATVVVAGCYVETNPGEVADMEEADLALGNVSKFELGAALSNLSAGGPRIVTGGEAPAVLPVRPIEKLDGRTNAYLNVQSGCDEICSFCVVRIARGTNRSADAGQVVAQVQRLSDAGVGEVVLSGVNLGDYGKGGELSFARLVRAIVDETDIGRIRFSSINPHTVTSELIDLMAERGDQIAPHLHIPLQSGSDPILAAMRRPYGSADYRRLLDEIAKKLPLAGIGADIMVGFPGESEDDFEASYRLLEETQVMMFHVFSYSPREGTEAATWPDDVDKQEKKRRSALLKELSRRKNRLFRHRFLGHEERVLVENSRDKKSGSLKGFTGAYLPVVIDGEDELMGRLITVRITGEKGDRLTGVPIQA